MRANYVTQDIAKWAPFAETLLETNGTGFFVGNVNKYFISSTF